MFYKVDFKKGDAWKQATESGSRSLLLSFYTNGCTSSFYKHLGFSQAEIGEWFIYSFQSVKDLSATA